MAQIEINSITNEKDRIADIQAIIRNANYLITRIPLFDICRIQFDSTSIKNIELKNVNATTKYAKFRLYTTPLVIIFKEFDLIIKSNETYYYEDDSDIIDYTIVLYSNKQNIMNEFIQALQNKDFKKVNELFNNMFYLNGNKITEINLGKQVVEIRTVQEDFTINLDKMCVYLRTVRGKYLDLITYIYDGEYTK